MNDLQHLTHTKPSVIYRISAKRINSDQFVTRKTVFSVCLLLFTLQFTFAAVLCINGEISCFDLCLHLRKNTVKFNSLFESIWSRTKISLYGLRLMNMDSFFPQVAFFHKLQLHLCPCCQLSFNIRIHRIRLPIYCDSVSCLKPLTEMK